MILIENEIAIEIRLFTQPDPLSGLSDALPNGDRTLQRRGTCARAVCPTTTFFSHPPNPFLFYFILNFAPLEGPK